MRNSRRKELDPKSNESSHRVSPADEEEAALVASGAMTLPKNPWDIDKLWSMPMAKRKGRLTGTQALLEEREEGY